MKSLGILKSYLISILKNEETAITVKSFIINKILFRFILIIIYLKYEDSTTS